jgi:P27 family predicted phage terminase small subunit
MGVITKADRDMMTLYCVAFSRWYGAEAKLKIGAILKGPNGGLLQSPYLFVADHAAKEMQKLSRMLGLDPVSRKKLGIRIPRPQVVADDDRKKELTLPNPKPATAANIRDLLEAQIDAVLQDPELTTQERARCISVLSRLSLRAIEDGELAASLEAMKDVLKTRKNGETKP